MRPGCDIVHPHHQQETLIASKYILACESNRIIRAKKAALCNGSVAQTKPDPLQPVVEKGKKRKGPLPMFLSQLLVLASFGGLGYVSIKKEEETRKALAVAAKATSAAYGKVEGLLTKKK